MVVIYGHGKETFREELQRNYTETYSLFLQRQFLQTVNYNKTQVINNIQNYNTNLEDRQTARTAYANDPAAQASIAEYMSKNRMSLLFEDGICRVPIIEKNTIEYARVNTHNVGKNRTGAGKYDYYEYDAAEEQKFRLEKQRQRFLDKYRYRSKTLIGLESQDDES